ncbi:hypothetical protein L6R49_05765 [Myxococcota bacterium]|nr:hypothetical protein [Myxococcota bacterium]
MPRVLSVLSQLVIFGLSLWVIITLGGYVAPRLSYPFDIEWMEGGMLVHALRVEQGLPLYPAPSAEFIPYIYPPLYPFLISLVGEPSYVVGRGLSILGAILAAAAAATAARREGAPWGIAVGAGAAFLTTWEESGTFMDLVRADAVAVGLAAWALTLARFARPAAVVASGLLLALAFLAKHNLALFGVPIALWLWWSVGWRRAALFTAASAGPALLATGLIQLATDGMFLTYLLGVPAAHPLVAERALPTITKELPTSLPLFAAASVAWLGVNLRRRDEGAPLWLGALAVAAGACMLMRAHHGGFINVLMPGHWALAAAGGAALGAFCRAFEGRAWSLPLVALLLGAQLTRTGWEEAEDYVPTEADRDAGEQLLTQLRAVEGEIFAPQFPWYPHLVGKQPSLPLISLWDIQHKRGPLYQNPSVVEEAMARQAWAALLVSQKDIKYGQREHYKEGARVRLPARAFNTRTGWRVRPAALWVPKTPADRAAEEARSKAAPSKRSPSEATPSSAGEARDDDPTLTPDP